MHRISIRGAGGGSGGSSHTSVNAPDSLNSKAYARIVDLVSEGEIEGFALGFNNALQCCFLDKTPIANTDGSLNFQHVQLDSRSGTQSQTYMTGFPDVQNEIAIGVELKSSTPFIKQFTDTDLSAIAVRLAVPNGLQAQNTSNGDITGYSIAYTIEIQADGGAWVLMVQSSFTGKSSSNYERSHRIDLPPATTSWNVRVTRTTPNANSSTVSDITNIVSMTEIVDGKFTYPNSAIVGIVVDASQFSSIPTRCYHLKGRIIQVPSNYDPVARTYTGNWDGSFKPAYSNNPAWVYWDMATHPRYGLGNQLSAAQVNKWALYTIAQYCDQLVPDGKGGMEPRFTCNLYLQARADAYKVMQDLASVFRGMSYYMGNAISASADMPTDPVYTYTAANVINGLFTYSGSARTTRYTVALVSWNNPANFYSPEVEYVPDQTGIARYGIQQTEVTAIGCTSQGQAQRVGKWLLTTSRLEGETVSFDVGLEGMPAAPGQIVRIADPNRMGRRVAGRISASTSNSITVDKIPPVINIGDTCTVTLPTGVTESHTISGAAGNVIQVSGFFTASPVPQSVWLVESTELTAPTYRVLKRKDNGDMTYTLTAVRNIAGKYAEIDNGTTIQIPPTSVLPNLVQPGPATVTLSGNVVVVQGIATSVLTIAWDSAPGAVQYQVEWRRDDADWVSAGRVTGVSTDIQGIYTGSYLARVRAINVSNIASLPTLSALTPIQGKTGAPPSLSFLTVKSLVFGIELDWGFPVGADDSQRTEIWYSQSPTIATATKLGDFAYPQNGHQLLGLAAGVSLFFWGRIVDRTGNIGPWYPTGAGVNGQSSSDATTVLSYLAGQIGETQLAHSLLGPIQAITPEMAGDPTVYAGDNTQYAGVWTQLSAQQDGDNALAAQINTVAASTTGFSALVQTETQARIDGDNALASQVTTTQVTAGNAQALAQTAMTTAANVNGSVSASYQIKVQIDPGTGKYYAAGMAIGVDNSTGIAQSQILFQADRFALIGTANGNIASPFVIQNGQTFISQAFIGTGWITNAMIGGVIQSSVNDSTGSPLWSIDKGGSMTMRGSGSGWRTERDGNGARLYDGNGVLRFRWGSW